MKRNKSWAGVRNFPRVEAVRYKQRVLGSVTMSPLLPSEWTRCVRLVDEELDKARENVNYVAADKTADPHVFETCVTLWARTHIETAAALLSGLSGVVPASRWRGLIGAEIEALTGGIEKLTKAATARNDPGGCAWHLSQVQRHIGAASATHAELKASMMVDAT